MYIKMLDGHKAGEIIDLRSDAALEFIRQGRAERAFQDPAPGAPAIVASKPAEPVRLHRKRSAHR